MSLVHYFLVVGYALKLRQNIAISAIDLCDSVSNDSNEISDFQKRYEPFSSRKCHKSHSIHLSATGPSGRQPGNERRRRYPAATLGDEATKELRRQRRAGNDPQRRRDIVARRRAVGSRPRARRRRRCRRMRQRRWGFVSLLRSSASVRARRFLQVAVGE